MGNKTKENKTEQKISRSTLIKLRTTVFRNEKKEKKGSTNQPINLSINMTDVEKGETPVAEAAVPVAAVATDIPMRDQEKIGAKCCKY
jgi:ACT domain-containing protein